MQKSMTIKEYSEWALGFSLPWFPLKKGRYCVLFFKGGQDEEYDAISIVGLDKHDKIPFKYDKKSDDMDFEYLDWDDIEIRRRDERDGDFQRTY